MTTYLSGDLVMPDADLPPSLTQAAGGRAPAPVGDVVPLHREIRNRWLLAQTSANTRAAYTRDTDEFFAWCDEFGLPPLALRRTHGDAYRTYLGDRGAPSTRARKLAAISSFYRFAMQDSPDIVETNALAAAKRPKVSKKSQTVGLTLDQAQRLFEVAAERGTWEHAMVRVLLHTGMRVSELVNATTADLRREGEFTTLRVQRKGGEHERLPLPLEAVAAIRTHADGRTGPLLMSQVHDGPATRQEVARVLGRLARAAGLSSLSPHDLRHTAATLAILYGGDDGRGAPVDQVQEMLGHTEIATTMRYVHAAGRVERSAVHGLAAAYRRTPPPDPANRWKHGAL